MRRAFVKRFASLGIALALAVGTLVPAASAAPEGKTVVLGFSQEPDTFVAGEGGLYVTQEAYNLIYSQLVVIDDLMRPMADLAVDVPTLDNGEAVMVGDGADQHLETTFHLRQEAKWSDGIPFTAEDVIFTWKLSLNPTWPAQAGNDIESKYADVVARDAHTVVFKMMSQNQARAAGQANQTGPVVHPLYIYGLPDVMMYPAKRMASLVDNDPQYSAKVKDLQSSVYGREPIGTGPYTLQSWDAGIQMVFKARADYFRGKPAIDNVVVRGFEASNETLLSQMQAGDIQTLGSEALQVSDVDAVNAIPGVKAYIKAGTTVEHIDLNLDNPILADKNVRKAIFYALDRQDLVNRVLAGLSNPSDSVIPPISPFFNPDTPKYSYNPDQAKQILDAAGWTVGSDGVRVNSAGQRLSFKYQSTTNAIRKKTMPLVKDQLAAVGIETNIDQVPAQTYFGKNGPLIQRTYDLGEYASVGTQDSGQDVVTMYSTKYIPSAANNYSGQNFPGFSNSSADQLIAAEINSLVPSTRSASMNTLQLLMADELPTLPLYFRPNVTAASNRLVNYKPEYASNGSNWNIWEWDLR
jgi:peptide/nickel transport system substrate-binding protein